VLREAGFDITFASMRGGEPPVDGVDREDTANARFLDDADVQAALKQTVVLADVDPTGFDAVYFPGGHGTMWDFPGDADIERIARAIWEDGGVVAAVCHGPAALVDIKLSDGSYLVAGREVATFTDDEERAVKLEKVVPFLLQSRLEERGAKVRTAPNWQVNVVASDRLITGQNPASARPLANKLIEVLGASKR
ncbi:MAG: type 1 glutamine amidotransferase domain-containing protein, partial [Myxococcota bacterium]